MHTANDYLAGNIGRVTVPAGKVVVHNHVQPARVLGTRGFRAWLSAPDDPDIERCDCEWAPELGEHYRVARMWRE
jgi:hypothetical protein